LPSSAHIYTASPPGAGDCLRQSEILSNVVRIRLDLATLETDAPGITTVIHELAVVMTQDCDLEQDLKVRIAGQQSDKILPNVLFCNVATAEALRGTPKTTGINYEMWKRISQNKDERYHFLQAVDASCDAQQIGLPEIGIDFKRYFSIPTDELYRRLEMGEAKRRCVLASPYLEHLSSRFTYFLSRVALPEEHFSEPGRTAIQLS
jgi:hypothetical protein